MKRLFFYLILFSAVMFAQNAAAASFHLMSAKVLNNARFTTYKTYSFLPYDQQNNRNNPAGLKFSETDYNNMVQAIRNELNKRGFTESSDGEMLIDIGITLLRKATVNTDLYPAYGGIRFYYPGYFRRGWAPYWRDRAYRAYTTAKIDRDGVLILDIIDSKRDVHLYSASVSTNLDKNATQWNDSTSLNEAAKLLFKKFPVKPLKQ
ncbi:MAG: DUF4136 domain-containing protein [Microbacter sp.]